MKRAFFLLFLLPMALSLGAQTGVVTGTVDFSTSLSDFIKAPVTPGTKIYAVTGTLGTVKILSDEGAPFQGQAEILEAVWESSKDLVGYTGILEFTGPAYAEALAEDRRDALPGMVVQHAKILAVVKLKKYQGPSPVFEILHYKILN